MSRNTLLALVFFCLAAAGGALGAQAAPCKTKNDGVAAEIVFDLNDRKVQEGLSISFQMGLLPAEYPAAYVAKIAFPCSRGAFRVAKKTVELFGENDAAPPLWAQIPGQKKIVVYFASTPQPETALAWLDAKSKGQSAAQARFNANRMMIAVTVYESGSPLRRIYAFLSELPGDELAKIWTADILSGARKPVAYYNVVTRRFLLPAPAKATP